MKCVALVCDQNHLKYASFVAFQIRTKSSKTLPIFILTTGIDSTEFENYFANLECVQIDIPSAELNSIGGKTERHVSSATFLKLWIPDKIPNFYDKCLYIDCDTYLNGNILELLETEFSNPVAAVAKKQDFLHLFEESKLGYFNAGIIIFNLKSIDKSNLMKEFRAIMISKRALPFQDQDVLNIIFKENWFPLSEIYNYYVYEFMNCKKESLENARIIHFIGSIKPWSIDSPYSGWWRKWRNEYSEIYPNDLATTFRNFKLYQLIIQTNMYKNIRSQLFPFIPQKILKFVMKILNTRITI